MSQPTEMAGKMYLDDIVTRPFEYRDGCLVVPSGPGLGVELDMSKVAEYGVEE